MQDENDDTHILRRWFSIGDLLSAVVTLIALGMVWGSLSSEVRVLDRDITPGARTEIATMRAKDDAHDRELGAIREEMRESRREITEALLRLEVKLDRHDDVRR
jgi:hypothetical protein